MHSLFIFTVGGPREYKPYIDISRKRRGQIKNSIKKSGGELEVLAL